MPDNQEALAVVDVGAESVGTSVLDVVVSAAPYGYSLVLMAATPEIIVDDVLVARGWGHSTVPVDPGSHRVTVHLDYGGDMQYPAALRVEASSATRSSVYYRLPALVSGAAAIGAKPQRSEGAGLLGTLLTLPVITAVLGMILVAGQLVDMVP